MRRIADAADGVVGYAIVDLTNGDRFERQADQPFPTASTIKLAILYELLRQADAKRLKLDDRQTDSRALRVGGSGCCSSSRIRCCRCATAPILMMMASDNTATNVVIDAVGMRGGQHSHAALGTPALALRRRMMDTEAARRGDENVASPADLARRAAGARSRRRVVVRRKGRRARYDDAPARRRRCAPAFLPA